MAHRIFFILMVVLTTFSCKHDAFPAPPRLVNPQDSSLVEPDDTCDPKVVYFNQVQQIFNSNCATADCHDMPNDTNDQIGLGTYNDIVTTVIDDGKFDDLLELIKWEDWDPSFVNNPGKWTKVMPPYPTEKLPDSLIQLIETWYDQGYTDKTCFSCDTSNVTWDSKVESLIRLNCHTSGCHGQFDPQGGTLITKAEVMAAMQDSSTYFMARLRHDPGLPAGIEWMPKGSLTRISDCKIASLEIWAANNYP